MNVKPMYKAPEVLLCKEITVERGFFVSNMESIDPEKEPIGWD